MAGEESRYRMSVLAFFEFKVKNEEGSTLGPTGYYIIIIPSPASRSLIGRRLCKFSLPSFWL